MWWSDSGITVRFNQEAGGYGTLDHPGPNTGIDSAIVGTSMVSDHQPEQDTGWRALGRWLRPRLVPALLILSGVGIAALIAYRSGQDEPPSAAESAFLVLASSALSIAGAAMFARIGRADPRHARSAVRRLISIGRDAGLATQQLELAIEADDIRALRNAAVTVNAQLVSMQLHLGGCPTRRRTSGGPADVAHAI